MNFVFCAQIFFRLFVTMTLILHVIFAAVLGSVFADDQITILPKGSEHIKEKGSSFALTCILNVPQTDLIKDFHWLDPRNQTIDKEYLKLNKRFSMPPPALPNQLALVLQNLNDLDVGAYTCRAFYDTRLIAQSVHMKTIIPITFIDAPDHQLARNDDKNFKLKCSVEARPSPTVSWHKSGVALVTGDKYIYENDGLIIRNVQESDDGAYSCQVMVAETGDFKSRSINLEVISEPVFSSDLSKVVNITEGEKAVIPCSATGKPAPSFSWIKGVSKKNLTTAPSYDGKLILDKVTKEDMDIFTCVATNLANTKQFEIKVNVRSKPNVVEVINSTIVAGKSGQLTCFVYGNPTPTVTIRKLGSPHQNYDTNDVRFSFNTKADSKSRPHTVEAIMKFDQVQKSDDGLYECVASNGIGETVSNLHLTVEYKPYFEASAMVSKVVTWKQRPANLTCIAQAIPNATITWYQGSNEKPLDKLGRPYYRFFSETGRSTLQITPIDTVVYGPYKCIAANPYGTESFPITLEEGFAPHSIQNVHANTTTASSVTFEFLDPAFTGNLPIKGYHCQYITLNQDWNKATTKVWPVGGPYIITGLAPLEKYLFRFATENEVGQSGWSAHVEVQTPQISAPSMPVFTLRPLNGEKYIRSSFANKIELRWAIPPSNGADIEKYTVRYCPTTEEAINRISSEREVRLDNDCVSIDIDYSAYLSSYVIEDVRPNTVYKVQLGARNSIGIGDAAEQFFKTNDVDEPGSRFESVEDEGEKMESLNSAVIIYIVVALLIGLLVIVDVFCFFVGKTGVIYTLCGGCCLKKQKNDDKLGRSPSAVVLVPTDYVTVMQYLSEPESRDLITNGLKNKVDIEEQSPMITDGTKRDTTVEYDVKKGISKTGFVGKDSAV